MAKTTSMILGEQLEAFIQERVASGEYASASESSEKPCETSNVKTRSSAQSSRNSTGQL